MLKQVKNTGYVFAVKAEQDFATVHTKTLIKHLVNLKQLKMKQSTFAVAQKQKIAHSVMAHTTANGILRVEATYGWLFYCA